MVSYSIRVFRGRDADGKQLKPWTASFSVLPTWTEKSARKKAEAFAATFEKECKEGTRNDTRLTFEEYAEYVIALKERTGAKHKTIDSYRYLTKRIYPVLGPVKLKDLRVFHLNDFYELLDKDGENKRGGKLSAKTIIEHHRFISTVLSQAEKEMLIPFNPAAKATLPKQTQKTPNYFQTDEINEIQAALKSEPPKWQMLVHLLMTTGCRRGEILSLKWDDVDFDRKHIHVHNNVLYTADRGIYIDSPKTESSNRYITLPSETINRLKRYRAWQIEERFRLQEYYQDQGYLFAQDNGNPMHPDSVTTWLSRFSKRHGLPHINPHAFRHTMASALFYNGADEISVSKRLGHAQVSTTTNIYGHIMQEADQRNADILETVFLKKA